MPDIKSHNDTVGGANFITVCGVQSAYRQIPVAADEQDETACVTQTGKWVFKGLPFDCEPFLISCTMSLAFAHFGPRRKASQCKWTIFFDAVQFGGVTQHY